MTLANIHFTPSRGVLLTDTLVSKAGQPHRFATKFEVLPHLHAILASRGRTIVHHDALAGLNLVLPLPEGLESVAAELPPHLRIWRDIREREMLEKGEDVGDMTTQVWVLGWSARRARVVCWRFFSENGYAAEELEPGLHLAPDFRQPVPPNATLQQMLAVCRLQKELMDAQAELHGTALSIGGDIWGVEVAEEGFKVKRLMGFADAPRTKAGFAEAAG